MKTAPLLTHTLITVATRVAIETGQGMSLIPVLHVINPSPREKYKTGGNSSQSQSHLKSKTGGIKVKEKLEVSIMEVPD